MASAAQVLAIARQYLGTVGNGSGNHAHILSVYNNHKPLAQNYKVRASDNWCDTFVSFVMITAGAAALTKTECGVERHTKLFKALGIWHEDGNMTPKAGDIIVYNWDDHTQPNDGFADHIGFVEKVSGRTITTIEGNKGNKVARRTLSVGAGQIRGYARPKYSGTTSSAASGASKSAGIKWTSENGTFKSDRAINLRESASASGKLIATLPAGSSVKYNAYAFYNGYVWIRQKRGSSYGYLATGTEKNGKRVSPKWGTFK
ncbi:CHAP domain-containing protein [Lacticaseibacillus sharpeae]|uniref:N-acetylmuramoyl-L-alanine amidase n=1 Tax=Lacticaseibacillus sharpeae JCM 1186 = DSM 20505 TaxID=1291052 RepID=A0A0R1ZIF8_9LACO|nr:CHAP domain-containing protein [Lacticaseibacillus sharpeae]KRM54637.1 putative endolysin [Lacticaseibacillus sharpeae JCM 1186 = DSM 20505]